MLKIKKSIIIKELFIKILKLNEESNNASVELNNLRTQISQNQPFVERAKEMQKEIKELEERIVLIKNLSKVRLREIKAIDYLHRQGAYAGASRPDLIILDLNLPKKNGREVRRLPLSVPGSPAAPLSSCRRSRTR